MSASGSPSSALVRFGAPGILLVSALSLSLFARAQGVGPKLGLMPTPLALWLLPAVSVLVYLGVRLSSGPTERSGDLLLAWIAAFPSMLHVVHLLFGLGVLVRIDRGLAAVVVVLHLGLAALLPGLAPGSPFGLRLWGALRSEAAWRRTHRVLGIGFALAAALAAATAWLPPRADLGAFLAGPAIALGMGLYAAFRGAVEDPEAGPRPTPGEHNPEDPSSSP